MKRNGRKGSGSDEELRVLGGDELKTLSKEQLTTAYEELAKSFENIKKDNAQLRESEDKLRAQHMVSTRRENVLVMRLNRKEQELQDYIAQLNELKSSISPTSTSLKTSLVDPAVNLVIQRMKKELLETKKKLEDTQNDLNAWKFTPDSNTGKRLMAKCRMLYQENEDLGKMITSGRLAKLESDLALQRSLTDEMKKSQSELDELVQELDEDVEGMQGTIYFLQQQLRSAKVVDPTPTTTSNSASTTQTSNNTDFQEELVSLSVKITDLCSQCQDAHLLKHNLSITDRELSDKMEVDNERTTNNLDNVQVSVNGEISSPSGSESSPAAVTNSYTNRTKPSVTTPNTISCPEILDSNASARNTVSSEIHECDSKPRTDVVSAEDETPPPSKRTKVSDLSSSESDIKQLQMQNTTSPISNFSNNSSGVLESTANRNGSIQH